MDELVRELKNQGVLEAPGVAAAFQAIDRKDFVRPDSLEHAYENHPLSIGENQTISQPYTVAFMLDLLDAQPGQKILEIGAGSGWQTALLAHIVSGGSSLSEEHAPNGKVYAIERIPELSAFGRTNIEKYGFIRKGIVTFLCRDGWVGLKEYAPFDGIIAAAASSGDIPEAWRTQLAIGGKIVAPVDDAIIFLEKQQDSTWHEKRFPGFAFVPLIHKENDSVQEGTKKHEPKALKSKHSFLLAIGLFLLAAGLSLWTVFASHRLPQEHVTIEVQPGSGSRVIGSFMKANGVIRSKWAFVIYATVTENASSLKPGRYQFTSPVSIPEVVTALVRGGVDPNEHELVIPEGWNLRDIGEHIAQLGTITPAQFWKITGEPATDYRISGRPVPPNFSREFSFLEDKPDAVGLEGYLFPDTYRIYGNAKPEEIVRKILSNFDQKLTPDIREAIQQQKKSNFEIITMASLLEKEIADDHDRKVVAGILWKRLAIGMPLQVDATISYITGKSGTPTSKDIALQSPFNTYRSPGLPLGPIANPGLDAIRAAITPEKSEYLYYLSTRDGKTIFSKTLNEHNRAKAQYLR